LKEMNVVRLGNTSLTAGHAIKKDKITIGEISTTSYRDMYTKNRHS